MHSGKLNKKRYDDLRKPMKQTSFIVKNLGGNLPKKQSTIVKRSFRSSIKPLSLDSTIPTDELTLETFYHFRTSKIFNIWMLPLSQRAVTSKGIPVLYINLQLNPYPNTQLDLFCSDKFFFSYTAPSTWLTNCADPNTRLQSPTREGCWLQSSSVDPNDEDQEDAWSQNPMVHKHSNFSTRTMN